MGEITGKGKESLEKHLGDDSTQQSLTNFAPKSVTNYRAEAGIQRVLCKSFQNCPLNNKLIPYNSD